MKMKKKIAVLFVLMLAAWTFASCDASELGEFDLYSLDVFNVTTPSELKGEPEKIYENAVREANSAKEKEVTITLVSRELLGNNITEELKDKYLDMDNDKVVFALKDDGVKFVSYYKDGTESKIIVDGIMYYASSYGKYKAAVSENEFEDYKEYVNAICELPYKNFHDEVYENVKIRHDGKLYSIEIPLAKKDMTEKDAVEGSITAKFDKDGNIVKYIYTTVRVVDKEENIRLKQAVEYSIKCSDVKITAPADADEYENR